MLPRVAIMGFAALKPSYATELRNGTGASMAKPKIVVSRLEGATWTAKGLRPFLEYRDLGLAEATDGRFGATIGRSIRKYEPGGGSPRHIHDVEFHMIFVMRGWLRSEFEGVGEVILREGDCLSYEGQIPQEHIEYSDDFQVMQITMPADYRTTNV
jgi:hypothetical protein